MASKSSVVAEACQAMENKCAAFLEALKTCSKEAAKVGSGMKAKYLELTQNVAAYVKTLTKGADAKALGNFPSKLACCTMLDGITFVNNKTKPLVAHTAAIQQLFGIIEFLYLRSAMRAGREEPVRIGMDNNELYIYVDMLFKVFETIAKLQKVDETVYLRTVQTVLQTFSQSSPIMVYEDILRRSFLFLDAMLKVEGKVVRPIVEGGVRQLMQCLLASPVKAKEAGGNVAKRLPSSAGATGPGSGHTASLATPPIMHIELILEVVSCLCSITRGEALSFMQNLKPESAAEVLVITVTAMPKGVLFQVPKLHALAKDELHSTVKYMLADGALLSSGCTTLAKILDHGFYYSNHCEEADRGAVRLFLALFNFVELELVDASTAEGLQRRIVWMKGLVAIMQSDDLLDDMHRQSTRRLLVDMVKFTVKQLRMVKENNLDKFFENMYKCGEGQQLISEQIDRLEEGQQRRGGAKMLPIFAVRLDPDSCAMDFCNMTHGVIGKTARISVADATDRPHLEAVEAALAVDGVLAAVHVLYSCVVSANCEKPLFAPYRIFYPKVAGSDPTPAGPQHVGSGDAASGSDSEGCSEGQSAVSSECRYLQEVAGILLEQLQRMLDVMRSAVMQESLIAVTQALLVVCSVFGWKQLYARCVEALTGYLALVERQFATDYRRCAMETWSLYLLHVRCLSSMMLNYAHSLEDAAWESFMEHLLTFVFISRRLGVATSAHLKGLEGEVEVVIAVFKGLPEEWEATLNETFGAFERLQVHDFEVLEGFVTHFGFHIAIPLLAKSHYAADAGFGAAARKRELLASKLAVMRRTLDAWPEEFVRTIESGSRTWPNLLSELSQALDRESVLARADPEFLHSLFGTLTDLPFARQHNAVMLLTGVVMSLARDGGEIEHMIQTICGNIVSLCLSGQEASVRSIDAGVCVLYKTLRDNAGHAMDVINGLKTVCMTVPQILALSAGIINCLVYATKHVAEADSGGATPTLIDVFAALVENSAEYLRDEACLPFVEAIFVLSRSAYSGDNNWVFRVVALVLEFAEKMAAASHFFGAGRAARAGEEEMWVCIFRGLRGLGLSEQAEVRQCAIKSLALFVKGRLNRFELGLWERCCAEMLEPLAEGLVALPQSSGTHATMFIACDELYVAFKDCGPRYRRRCERVMAILMSGLEHVVLATLENKALLPNELNSALGLALGIATNVVIDYYAFDVVWDRCSAILQALMRKELDLLRQNFFKSICSILTALGEREDGIEEKLMQVVRLALGDPSPEEADELDALGASPSDRSEVHPWLAVPPWLVVGAVPPAGCGEELESEGSVDAAAGSDGSYVTPRETDNRQYSSDCGSEYGSECGSGRGAAGLSHPTAATSGAAAAAPTGVPLYESLKLADDPKIKFTLRDKIQNSIGILQEMQMLQLVTLHYTPQMLTGTEALSRVAPEDVAKALDRESAAEEEGCGGELEGRSVLGLVLEGQERLAVVENIAAHVKEPPLVSMVETYSPVSKVFRCLGSIKSPKVYEMLVRTLVNKYAMGDAAKAAVALQLVDNVVLSVRDILLRFLQESADAVASGDGAAVGRFLESQTYRMMLSTAVQTAPLVFEIAKRLLRKHRLQLVAVVLYQACINVAKYVYFGLYVNGHFLQVGNMAGPPVVAFWRSVVAAARFFAALTYPDELETRIRNMRLLHAVTIELGSALVVNPFSVAPPFVYAGVAEVLDMFARGQSAVLRRIALQRLSDAACYPFVPRPLEAPAGRSPRSSAGAVRMRAALSKRFFAVLSAHLGRFLSNKECEIEVLAALQVVESIRTLPNELLFEPGYLHRHRYLKLVHKRPLVSLAMPYLLELLESENKRVIRCTRRILSLFLEEMGAQVSLARE